MGGRHLARAIAIATLAASSWLSADAAHAQEPTGSGFTASERARLDAGELVVRPSTQRRGGIVVVGGTAFQVVDQPVDVTWRALCDSPRYHRMMPSTSRSDIVDHSPGRRVVRLEHSYGPMSASYHLDLRYDHARHDISFRLDGSRPNDLRAAWGFLAVQPFGTDGERSLVSWGIMADLGGGVVGGIFRDEVREWMMRVPSTIRAYLHGSGARRYGS